MVSVIIVDPAYVHVLSIVHNTLADLTKVIININTARLRRPSQPHATPSTPRAVITYSNMVQITAGNVESHYHKSYSHNGDSILITIENTLQMISNSKA